jgi:hypothetical protein
LKKYLKFIIRIYLNLNRDFSTLLYIITLNFKLNFIPYDIEAHSDEFDGFDSSLSREEQWEVDMKQIEDKIKKYQSYSLQISKQLGILPTLETINQDLKEIKILEKDETLTDIQKSRLQNIKQIWQEIEKELKK